MKSSEIQFLAEESERTLFTLQEHIKEIPQILHEVVDLPSWAEEHPLGTVGAAFLVGLEGAHLLRRRQCQQVGGGEKVDNRHHANSFLSTLSSLSSILPRMQSISQVALSIVTGVLGAKAVTPSHDERGP